ncbi:hypothetical protein ACFXGI_35420 [Streptomyces sp. NPDC059355]|uniref:hypothetical protein n=1 Tax=Streptomyces sp. NPDC059355 TaxID=3346811 RepID=UPI0036B5D3EB
MPAPADFAWSRCGTLPGARAGGVFAAGTARWTGAPVAGGGAAAAGVGMEVSVEGDPDRDGCVSVPLGFARSRCGGLPGVSVRGALAVGAAR